MSAFEPKSENRFPSPSPAGLVRRHRSADSEAAYSPGRRNPSCYARGGRYGRERSSVSLFERSGRTTMTTNQNYRKVAPAGDDHVTYGRGGGNDDDNDDDWMCDDDVLDGDDGGELSTEEVRKSGWLRDFLSRLAEMKPEEVTDPLVETLCPACKGGPGRSLWYRGFQALLDHARGVRAKRVWLHRRFAQILEEELRNRSGKSTTEGGAAEQATVADQKWQGLGGTDDRMIPWPPMVVVLNTRLGKQEGFDKWVGIGNPDLVDCFKEYEPVKAWSAYNSQGHCGASLLIFNSSVFGYYQAERLHNHFKQQGRGKYEWHKEKPWKQQATEKRLLYGYMATKEEDLTMFSTHYGDKQKPKFDMKSYQMVVGNPLREMYEANQKQPLLKREIEKEIETNKKLDGKLRQRELEIKATMRMITEQSVEHKEEIESLREICEILNSKLKEREASPEKMTKQCSSSQHSAGDDHDEAGSSGIGNKMNTGDGENDSPDNKTDEIADEKHYLGTCDSEEKKKKRPLLWGFF